MEYRTTQNRERITGTNGADTAFVWHQGVHVDLGRGNDHAIIYSDGSNHGHNAVIEGGEGRNMLSIRSTSKPEHLRFTDLLDGWVQVADDQGVLATFRNIDIIRFSNGQEVHYGDPNDPNDLEEALARQSVATLNLSRQGEPSSSDMTIHRGSSRS